MPAAHPDAKARARVGLLIAGKWRIDALIGTGGMAAVYAATHRNNKRAALKFLRPELSAHEEIRSRFLREGYAANKVGHEGVVRVDDDEIAEDGSAFLVMELLTGETLDRRAERKGGRLPAAEVLAVADQLLDVLVAAHEKGVVHRDLKPENLFLTERGVLKVLDFGIARLRELGDTNSTTKTGAFLGTPTFMAPEQARGRWQQVDARTDLWAVGAIMFCLLTGRVVHDAETSSETLALAITERAPNLASIAPDLPESLCVLVDRALQYDKDARYPDATAMQQAVRECYGKSVGSESQRPPALSIAEGSFAPSRLSLNSQPTLASAVTLAATDSFARTPHVAPRSRKRLLLGAMVAAALIASLGVWLVRNMSRHSDARSAAVGGAPAGSAKSSAVAENAGTDGTRPAIAGSGVANQPSREVGGATQRSPDAGAPRAAVTRPPAAASRTLGTARKAAPAASQPAPRDPFAKRH